MEYCYKCGTKLTEKECFNCNVSEGIVPYCPTCHDFRFPFFNTAVSTVIYNNDCSKILLIKQYSNDWNILVAGYVSKGETLEHALIREIKEEVGINVTKYMFNESQYFEKSNSLICNFISIAESEKFVCNNEVDYAAWYEIETAKEIILKHGLAEYFLLKSLNKFDLVKQTLLICN